MKSDLYIDLSHVLHHFEMEESTANHSLLRLPDSVALSMFLFLLYSLCSVLTTYDLAVQRGVITSALFQVSPNFIATGSLARNVDRFPLAFLFRCRISASLDDWPCRGHTPRNFHVLVVWVWMLSPASSSIVGLETVEQESVQCREFCFCSQAALCMGLWLSLTSVLQSVQFFLLVHLLMGGTDWMLCVWCSSP